MSQPTDPAWHTPRVVVLHLLAVVALNGDLRIKAGAKVDVVATSGGSTR